MKGNLRKMTSRLDETVQYALPLSKENIAMNALIGSEIQMHHTGLIHCVKCGRKTSKSFSQGFCFPCFQSAPETEECVMRPELCLAHEGIARDMEYAKNHCLIDQYVYLSLTSEVKVGVTRSTQLPTRWIDQGATQAIVLAQTPNRHLAGLIEVSLKQYMPDKTNWRNMLKGISNTLISLPEVKDKVIQLIPIDLQEYIIDDDTVTQINYPVTEYPVKIVSLSFDKTPVVQGILTGIKGQYLLFDNNRVINIRKFGGYEIQFRIV